MSELAGGAVEDDLALVEDKEFRVGVEVAVGDFFHLVGGGVPAVRGQGEGVLQAVRDEQRSGAGDVALLDDQLDDGG